MVPIVIQFSYGQISIENALHSLLAKDGWFLNETLPNAHDVWKRSPMVIHISCAFHHNSFLRFYIQ